MEAVIREATPVDQAGLAALWCEADALHHAALPGGFAPPAAPARSPGAVAAVLADPAQGLLVAQAGARPVGLVGLVHLSLRERHPPLVERRFAVVEAVVVAAAERGGGRGRRLLAAAEGWARARGAGEVWLDVWEFNAAAIGFYEALGYRAVSRRMRLDLAP